VFVRSVKDIIHERLTKNLSITHAVNGKILGKTTGIWIEVRNMTKSTI